MVKIEAIIHPSSADRVKDELTRLGISNVAISQVWMHDNAPSSKTCYRGAEYFLDAPYLKLEALISSLQVDEVTDGILRTARTEFASDKSTIAVFECADAIRIRDGKRVGLTAR